MKKNYLKMFQVSLVLLIIFLISNISNSMTSFLKQKNDTIYLTEVNLDTVKFVLFEETENIENTKRDTILINLGENVYKIPYRISANVVLDNSNRNKFFKLTGLSLLENEELESFLRDLFSKPRGKLKEVIPPKYWQRHEIYLRYFEPYDKFSPYLTGNTLNMEYDEEEVDDNINIIENYEGFPLPETIDIEVDLRKIPKTVKILDLEFDFDKLDKRFQRLLLNIEDTRINKNRKSNLK